MLALYLFNLLSWFWIVPFVKGLYRYLYIFVAGVLVSSYAGPFMVSSLLNVDFSVVILDEYVEQSLFYSALAGAAFSFGYLLFGIKKSFRLSFDFKDRVRVFVNSIPDNNWAVFFYIATILSLGFSYYQISQALGVFYNRLDWYNSDLGRKVQEGLQLASLFFLLSIILNYKKSPSRLTFSKILLFLIGLSIVIGAGFDGSRRPSSIVLFGFLIAIGISSLSSEVTKELRRFSWIAFFILFLLISFFTVGRGGPPGWPAIQALDSFSIVDLKHIVYVAFVPIATAHVNTRMIDYVELFGEQGYLNYGIAILNTLFPRFLFGDYLFGEPLAIKLQSELGWVGFDFGYMAEAIYSGGLLGVVLMHFILSLFYCFILRKAVKGKLFFILLTVFFYIALVNSIRSDFMNLLKMMMYPSVALYVFFQLLKVSRIKKKL